MSFNKLLLPKGIIPISHVTRETRKGKYKQSREVEDLATWLEAWNRYLCVRVASSPTTALELAKYQTLMGMFFTHHQAEQCIHYDDLFRRAAAQDPTLRWDAIKEDIYVWAFIKHTQKPAHTFRDKPPSQAVSGHQLLPHQSNPLTESPSPLTELPTPQLAKKYASDSTLLSAPEGMTASSPMCVGTSTARVHTLARGAPINPELQRAHQRHSQIGSKKSHTPLQYTQFERELQHHPDKSWTYNLLHSIQLGLR